jgi:hypothetical protein
MAKYMITVWENGRLVRRPLAVPERFPSFIGFLLGFGLITFAFSCSFLIVSVFK